MLAYVEGLQLARVGRGAGDVADVLGGPLCGGGACGGREDQEDGRRDDDGCGGFHCGSCALDGLDQFGCGVHTLYYVYLV